VYRREEAQDLEALELLHVACERGMVEVSRERTSSRARVGRTCFLDEAVVEVLLDLDDELGADLRAQARA